MMVGSHVDAYPLRSASRTIGLDELWAGLLRGEFSVTAGPCFDDRVLAYLESPTNRAPIDPRAAGMLSRALRGVPQKVLAFDLDVSPAVIARACRAALQTMASERSLSHVPIILVMGAYATVGGGVDGALVEGCLSERSHSVVSVPNPTRALKRWLSPAEYEVARLVIEGRPPGVHHPRPQRLIAHDRESARLHFSKASRFGATGAAF